MKIASWTVEDALFEAGKHKSAVLAFMSSNNQVLAVHALRSQTTSIEDIQCYVPVLHHHSVQLESTHSLAINAYLISGSSMQAYVGLEKIGRASGIIVSLLC